MILPQWITHRDPRYFEAPEEFRPQRWTKEFERLPNSAHFSFGNGARKCIGINLARIEAGLIPATLVQRFSLRPAFGFGLDLIPYINLQPKNGIRLVLGGRLRSAPYELCPEKSRIRGDYHDTDHYD